VTYGQVPIAERRRVRQQLKEYCGLDTGGMVRIVGELEKITTDCATEFQVKPMRMFSDRMVIHTELCLMWGLPVRFSIKLYWV
jgi:hypothetical protein